MKKILSVIIFYFLSSCFISKDCFGSSIYNSVDTITLSEYLYMRKSHKDLKALKLNENGDVIFKNKVVLTDNGTPLNDDTAYTTIELKLLFAAEGIKPRRWCNPRNTKKNGTLGCYIDNPDK